MRFVSYNIQNLLNVNKKIDSNKVFDILYVQRKFKILRISHTFFIYIW